MVGVADAITHPATLGRIKDVRLALSCLRKIELCCVCVMLMPFLNFDGMKREAMAHFLRRAS